MIDGAPGPRVGCCCSCRNTGGSEVQGTPEVKFAGLRQGDADENAKKDVMINTTTMITMINGNK